MAVPLLPLLLLVTARFTWAMTPPGLTSSPTLALQPGTDAPSQGVSTPAPSHTTPTPARPLAATAPVSTPGSVLAIGPTHPDAHAPSHSHGHPNPHVTTPDPRANQTVCYQYVGCFDNFPPFNNANLDLPADPDVLQNGFLLFTRSNPGEDEYDELSYRDTSTFNTSHFDPKLHVKVILHGFSQSGNTTWVRTMKNELLKREDLNVLVVDWGRGSAFPDYPQAVANTRLVAIETRLLLEEMVRRGTSLSNVHLIGHSLGAHTSGYTGYLMGGRLGRITGLDPAEPDFENLAELVRLDAGDGQLVDVMHTNGAPILLGGAGLKQVSGHVDFFVNGGESQPGCSLWKGLLNGTGIGEAVSCSHGRAHEYFIESINSDCPFTSYPCSSYEDFQKGKCLSCGKVGCSQMGYYADQYPARGKMYLNTGDAKPFCGFHYAVTFFMPNGTDSRGKLAVSLKGAWGQTGLLTVTDADDTTLKAGQAQTRLVVSPVEVGDVTSVVIKYSKFSGGWFFGKNGQDQIQGDKLEVVSGENGYTYLFCLQQTNLVHDQEREISVSPRHAC